MRIHGRFVGGNIRVARVEEDTVYLEQELRDTMEWWFYWGFCVEGAQGKTLSFHFTNRDVVGYWGPAVSRDNVEYRWAGAETVKNGHLFTYTFAEDETRVFFRYALPYQLTNYENWLRRQSAPIQTGVFCVTERGRNLPFARLGDPDAPRSIVYTSRHHACESMATWALEGAFEEMIDQRDRLGALGCNLIVIPFIDLDGVEDGDQGKARAPHDQNRDYLDEPLYEVTRALGRLVKERRVIGYIDYHDPWYLGDVNDFLCLLRGPKDRHSVTDDFAECLMRETARDADAQDILYTGEHDLFPGELWVPASPNPATSVSFFKRIGANMAISIEIPYFGKDKLVYAQKNVSRLGRCFTRALLTVLEDGKR